MRIITFNVNGIRAVARKGFFDWFAAQNADIICLQEIKAQLSDLTESVFYPQGYHCVYHGAEKKGYSGVAVYTRIAPHTTTTRTHIPLWDEEGRCIQMDFEHFSVVSLYIPSGSSSPLRQAVKFQFLEDCFDFLKSRFSKDRPVVVCGDFNIVHRPMDIKNFRSNQNQSGCLPEERAWMEHLLSKEGWIDVFRYANPNQIEYTWWSHRGRAWERNTGWRIDYQIATPCMEPYIRKAWIDKTHRFSDHAPVVVDYDIPDALVQEWCDAGCGIS